MNTHVLYIFTLLLLLLFFLLLLSLSFLQTHPWLPKKYIPTPIHSNTTGLPEFCFSVTSSQICYFICIFIIEVVFIGGVVLDCIHKSFLRSTYSTISCLGGMCVHLCQLKPHKLCVLAWWLDLMAVLCAQKACLTYVIIFFHEGVALRLPLIWAWDLLRQLESMFTTLYSVNQKCEIML